ncbi:MAG: MFS transporter, partial [Verrucomicrobiia bacterium]
MSNESDRDAKTPWWKGVTRYQWLVLVIASLGWVFDTFEGQIFVTSMNEMMASLLPPDVPSEKRDAVAKMALGVFLIGGAVGGVFFGMLSDRIGRARTMIITILVYSVFT